ncbi:HNH endonuclease [Streptosporangium sp. NPDC051022]|uniref:HNH endonuclease n=1 Tax=Streptosporangium sp. NPDC051022 TaxID=3155752 RepID=UPI0034202700
MPNGQWKGHNRQASLPKGWPAIRQHVLERDNHTCYKCGGHATHVDHVQNAAAGGSDDYANLAAICVDDHRSKSSAEGGRARAAKQGRRQRPPEKHPGLRD